MELLGQIFLSHCADLSVGLHKPDARFLRDAIFGTLARRCLLLSEWGRALKERRPLIYTEQRLSRRAGSERFDDAAVEQSYLQKVGRALEEMQEPVIALDPSDIQKPHARSMPFLGEFRDGSTGRVGSAYAYVGVEAVDKFGRRMPLAAQLYSNKHPEFRSERFVIRDLIRRLRPHVPDRAIWAFDRAFDGRGYLADFADAGIDFVVRLKAGQKVSRALFVDGQRTTIDNLVTTSLAKHSFKIRRFKKRDTDRWLVRVAWVRRVQTLRYSKGGASTGRPNEETYSLVIAHGGASNPWILLTNKDVQTRADAQQIVNSYFDRWASEDAHRFQKVAFSTEGLRTQSWTSLSRLLMIAMLAYGLMALTHFGAPEVTLRAAATYLAFGPVPDFLFYRLVEPIASAIEGLMKSGP